MQGGIRTGGNGVREMPIYGGQPRARCLAIVVIIELNLRERNLKSKSVEVCEFLLANVTNLTVS